MSGSMWIEGRRAIALVGLAALVACVVVSRVHPPVPLVHDEFSYLLAGETFARGRLANPAPRTWQPFETMHVLLQPTYASKYPAGQGLMLALGETLAGRPLVGVWLSMTFAAMAVCWMLQGWLRGPWPLAGAMAVALHPGLVQQWGATYWGGAVALLGGALVFGALPRLLRRPDRLGGAALGIGLGVLALSRPFEGLVAAVPVVLILLRHRVRGGAEAARDWRGAWAPMAVALLATLAFMAAHDRAVTGSILQLPYAEYHRQYETVPLFLFQDARQPPSYNHAVQKAFFDVSAAHEYRRRRTLEGLLDASTTKLTTYLGFFSGWALGSIALAAALLVPTDRRVRFALACSALFALTLAVQTFEFPHYAAPFLPVGVLLFTLGLRACWQWRGGLRPVRALVIVVVVAGFWLHGVQADLRARHRASFGFERRSRIIERLEAEAGRHLVVVRYGARHNPHLEWVQNGPDLPGSRVLFAREMDRPYMEALIDEFPGRRLWLWRPDRPNSLPVPYSLGDVDDGAAAWPSASAGDTIVAIGRREELLERASQAGAGIRWWAAGGRRGASSDERTSVPRAGIRPARRRDVRTSASRPAGGSGRLLAG